MGGVYVRSNPPVRLVTRPFERADPGTDSRHICQNVSVSDGVWLVVGIQAAGKSTVADLLARQFERGVHVRGGQFYRWAVTGWIHPWDIDQGKARNLLDLRYRLSALAAAEYCQAGFTTVVQDSIFGEDIRTWLQAVPVRPRHLVVLRPSVAVVVDRDHARQQKPARSPTGPKRQNLTNSIRCW
jgi:AAA domain